MLKEIQAIQKLDKITSIAEQQGFDIDINEYVNALEELFSKNPDNSALNYNTSKYIETLSNFITKCEHEQNSIKEELKKLNKNMQASKAYLSAQS